MTTVMSQDALDEDQQDLRNSSFNPDPRPPLITRKAIEEVLESSILDDFSIQFITFDCKRYILHFYLKKRQDLSVRLQK
jgi:hypothetical protein